MNATQPQRLPASSSSSWAPSLPEGQSPSKSVSPLWKAGNKILAMKVFCLNREQQRDKPGVFMEQTQEHQHFCHRYRVRTGPPKEPQRPQRDRQPHPGGVSLNKDGGGAISSLLRPILMSSTSSSIATFLLSWLMTLRLLKRVLGI